MPIIHSDRYPTVTVVTPSYNQGEFIAETIESVFSQTGDFFIDYIIMDGASTDNSVEIIQKYDGMLNRGEWPVACKGISYRWVSDKDDGQADAVNKGFSLAKGEILGWLNSDDTYLPGTLAKVFGFFSANPETVMMYGNAYYTDKAGEVTGSYRTERFDFQMLAEDCYICQPSVFIRSAVLKEIGQLDASLHTCMDYDLWIRVGKRFENRIAFIDDYLATSRMYAENKTLSQRDLVYRESMETVQKHFGYLPGRWIVHCILEVLQNHRTRSLGTTLKKLGARLSLSMRYLRYPQNIKATFSFLAQRSGCSVPKVGDR